MKARTYVQMKEGRKEDPTNKRIKQIREQEKNNNE